MLNCHRWQIYVSFPQGPLPALLGARSARSRKDPHCCCRCWSARRHWVGWVLLFSLAGCSESAKMAKHAQKGMQKMILKVMRSLKARSKKPEGGRRKSSALVWGEGDTAKQPRRREDAEGREGSSSPGTKAVARRLEMAPSPCLGARRWLGCCSPFWTKTVSWGGFSLLSEDSKAGGGAGSRRGRGCPHSQFLM